MSKAKYSDPTVETVALKLNGGEYELCFTFGALATAESYLRRMGHADINMLRSFDFSGLGASDIAPLLFAAMLPKQPKTKYEDVAALVSFKSFEAILEALTQAYVKSMAEPEKNEVSEHADGASD
ncbi:MAG TPA: hypothetical protein VFN53_06445 [Acidobacteriaceae bacterium]|nr:hypothetical protein [Acidobacteriaceae bacterium]